MISLEIRRRRLNARQNVGDYDVLLTLPDKNSPRTIAYDAYVQHFDRSRGAEELLREAVEAVARKLP